jgi:hypothetical protein
MLDDLMSDAFVDQQIVRGVDGGEAAHARCLNSARAARTVDSLLTMEAESGNRR